MLTCYIGEAATWSWRTLSWACLPEVNLRSAQKEVEAVNMAQDLPVSAAQVDAIRKHTEEDDELQELIKVILTGWLEDKSQVPNLALPYYNVCNELTVQNGVIFGGQRVVVPKSLCRDMLEHIYALYLGIDGCQRPARECFFWPRMRSEIKDHVQRCVGPQIQCSKRATTAPRCTITTRPIPIVLGNF